jgi:4-deoxy-L-threo-5-hexosulose-uronate ketol-isomerase
MVKPFSLPAGQLQDSPALPLNETSPLDPHRVAEPAHLPESIRLPYLPSPEGLAGMSTAEIRKRFLLGDLFESDRVVMYHSELDRATVGGIVPGSGPLELLAPPEFSSDSFAQRRELGVFNIGGPGIARVDGIGFRLAPWDAIYIGCGSRDIRFESEDGKKPALFYFVSYPAHASYETKLVSTSDAESSVLGTTAAANRRTIRKYIRPPAVKTSQLTMGLTALAEGSVWNTMPVHRHQRRSEIYLYFDLPEDAVVFHCLGEPRETRHVLVRNRQAVISPSWSIHAGVGTAHYSFIWAMGGENREFSDMDPIPMEVLA